MKWGTLAGLAPRFSPSFQFDKCIGACRLEPSSVRTRQAQKKAALRVKQDRSTRGLSQTAADLGLAGENVEHRQGSDWKVEISVIVERWNLVIENGDGMRY
eukprot:s3000_g25.t1